MRIESVHAGAFGPLIDADLVLAPGLTVIVGANESAKSTWHAAIYAGLCGRRRGRGAATRADKAFSDLHRPWDGGDWRASVVIRLDAGTRIEIAQDLAGKVDSRAVDATFGRDVSGDIMFEGSPDGSRFLGLDRDSFLATACINQAALLRVLDEADGLQDHIASAAATAGTDANAATALTGIAAFAREHVGVDRQGARKPLRMAKEAVAEAAARVVAARAEHEQYVADVSESEALRESADAAAAEAAVADDRAAALERLLAATREAADADAAALRERERAEALHAQCEAKRRRLERATELDASLGGQEPPGLAAADEVSRVVADALAGWRTATRPEPLAGDSAASLRAQVAALPDLPEGDREVDPSVRRAADALAQRQAVQAAHTGRRPVALGAHDAPELAAAAAATASVVRDLAAELAAARAVAAPDASAVAALEAAEASSRSRAEALRARADEVAMQRAETRPPVETGAGGGRRTLLLSGAGAALILGIGLVILGRPLAGAAAVVAALALGAAAIVTSGSTRAEPTVDGLAPAGPAGTGPGASDAASVADAAPGTAISRSNAWAEAADAERAALAAQERLRAARTAMASAAAAQADVRSRCEARGLPADVDRLRSLAAAVERERAERTALAEWAGDEAEYSLAVTAAERRLHDALVTRGMAVHADPSVPAAAHLDEYARACARRSEEAAAGARRPDLLHRLAAREQAERSFDDAVVRHGQATAAVLDAAALVGCADEAVGADAGASATALTSWQAAHAQLAGQADASRAAWAELVALLDGSTLDQLRQEAAQLGSGHADAMGVLGGAEARSVEKGAVRDDLALRAAVDPLDASDVARMQVLTAEARARLEELRSAAVLSAGAADRAEAVRSERAGRLASVAVAEERLAKEQEVLDRVNRLATTLDLTSEFLGRAQERVHRDIAPVLVRTLEAWLPSVTGGRYVNARVDPASLVVQVRGPRQPWRQADRLSVGTAEQVYLLLRVALAEHLTKADESCPLLLDDVTVQADAARTEAILDLLLRLSQDRQIVLFAQEPMVAQWAVRSLSGDQHALIELPQVASA